MIFRQYYRSLASAALLSVSVAVVVSDDAFAQAGETQTVTSRAALLANAIEREAGGKIGRFYKSRQYRPVWVEDGLIGPDAQVLLRYLDHAELDGLKGSRHDPDELREDIARADSKQPEDLARAEIALSRAFARYVEDMRRTRDVGMEFAGDGLKPPRLKDDTVLRVATRKNFSRYLRGMEWMSPHYVRVRELLRKALANGSDEHVVDVVRLNLERARFLPSADVRHIVVDAATARLWYYQDGKEVGTMKVVVGAAKTQTPLLAGYVNYAILNPYWNVPDYLTRDNVARKILSGRTLDSMHMQVLSDWGPNPRLVDPATVNWQAVAAGQQDVRVRELPGPANSMGKVKFLFPNDHGIYLHDTPNTDLLRKADRHLSNGCIRLEKAFELGKWMMGKPVVARTSEPEQAVPLPVPVPVYLTYLTATGTKKGITLLDDVYGRDGRVSLASSR